MQSDRRVVIASLFDMLTDMLTEPQPSTKEDGSEGILVLIARYVVAQPYTALGSLWMPHRIMLLFSVDPAARSSSPYSTRDDQGPI